MCVGAALKYLVVAVVVPPWTPVTTVVVPLGLPDAVEVYESDEPVLKYLVVAVVVPPVTPVTTLVVADGLPDVVEV